MDISIQEDLNYLVKKVEILIDRLNVRLLLFQYSANSEFAKQFEKIGQKSILIRFRETLLTMQKVVEKYDSLSRVYSLVNIDLRREFQIKYSILILLFRGLSIEFI